MWIPVVLSLGAFHGLEMFIVYLLLLFRQIPEVFGKEQKTFTAPKQMCRVTKKMHLFGNLISDIHSSKLLSLQKNLIQYQKYKVLFPSWDIVMGHERMKNPILKFAIYSPHRAYDQHHEIVPANLSGLWLIKMIPLTTTTETSRAMVRRFYSVHPRHYVPLHLSGLESVGSWSCCQDLGIDNNGRQNGVVTPIEIT